MTAGLRCLIFMFAVYVFVYAVYVCRFLLSVFLQNDRCPIVLSNFSGQIFCAGSHRRRFAVLCFAYFGDTLLEWFFTVSGQGVFAV